MSRDHAKILVVDDDPDVLLLLRVILEEHGFTPLLASDGQTGLRRIEEERPELVLLDVMMPVMDGWNVLEALAAKADPPRVIVISAKTSDEDRTRAGDLGATGYLTKPFTPDALIRTIRHVLGLGGHDGQAGWLEMLRELQAGAPTD